MKYWAPINSPGGIDGNDSYVNANPSIGVQGSIPTFQSFEQTLRALQNLIVKSHLTPNASINDLQVAEAIRSQWLNWATTFGGTADALTCQFDPTPTIGALVGMPIHGIASATNTGPCTLTVAGIGGSPPIVRPNGTPLAAGDIVNGQILVLMYDGTRYQYVNFGAGQGGGGGAPSGNYSGMIGSWQQLGTFTPPSGVITGWGNWGPGAGNTEIVNAPGGTGFNTTNGLFTVPANLGGLWWFAAYANTLTGPLTGQQSGPGFGYRLYKGPISAGYLISATNSPANLIVHGNVSTFAVMNPGDQMQFASLANEAGLVFRAYTFTALRIGT